MKRSAWEDVRVYPCWALYSASNSAERGNENARKAAIASFDDPVFRNLFTRRVRFAFGCLRGVEGNDPRECRGRKREVARVCGAYIESKRRRAHRHSCVYTSAGRTCSSSHHLWHRLKGCSDILRPKPVSAGRFHRGHISRHRERSFIDRNNRHDFTGVIWHRHG